MKNHHNDNMRSIRLSSNMLTTLAAYNDSQKSLLPYLAGVNKGDLPSNNPSKSSPTLRLLRLGPKFTKAMKAKLRLGARILQVGGMSNMFKLHFGFKEGEQLLKVSRCNLSTTTGPIAGVLFITTYKVAFCSDKSINVSSSTGESLSIQYKVSIPLEKINRAYERENARKQSTKYIQIVTLDKFDFWFMGFSRCRKTLDYLNEAIIRAAVLNRGQFE
ncbi:hypothetical protein Leryth_001173 [Lithospermum erythrorhizon]|uniref:GRAM domain-containing protein n=1 Tax=Lithospermum erythrorhizon TaxID=34254 RepID=A0AAV3RUM3_LITER|nr:hypothetical protein Leryth_001173 [Lithospermum erythrorhizon]